MTFIDIFRIRAFLKPLKILEAMGVLNNLLGDHSEGSLSGLLLLGCKLTWVNTCVLEVLHVTDHHTSPDHRLVSSPRVQIECRQEVNVYLSDKHTLQQRLKSLHGEFSTLQSVIILIWERCQCTLLHEILQDGILNLILQPVRT